MIKILNLTNDAKQSDKITFSFQFLGIQQNKRFQFQASEKLKYDQNLKKKWT